MATYIKRMSKKSGPVWDVTFRAKENNVVVQKKLTGFHTKKDAQRAYAQYKKLGSPADVPSSRARSTLSFTKVFNAYIEAKQGILSPGSIREICAKFRKLILPYFKSRQIDTITRSDIAKWQEKVWNLKNQKDVLYAQTTCKTTYEKFCTFMEWASEVYSFPNPFLGLKAPRRRTHEKEMAVWTTEQFAEFLKQINAPKYKIFFSLLFVTGCRKDEINALTADDFSKENGRYFIKISKSVSAIKGQGHVVTPPKTVSSNRTISLPAGMTTILDDFLKDKSGYLWNMEPGYPNCMLRQALEKTNLPPIRVNDLRHSHASILISSGIPASTVAKRLGHTSVRTTLDVYSHSFASDEQKILEILNKPDK